MQRIIVCVLLLLITVTSFPQRIDSIQPLMYQMYLEKSKRQNTTGWAMLGTGLVLVGLGAALVSNTDDDADWTDFNTFFTGNVIGCVGVLSSLGGIPLLIASARNKTKAKRLSTGFGMQRVICPSRAGLVAHSTPALSLQISF